MSDTKRFITKAALNIFTASFERQRKNLHDKDKHDAINELSIDKWREYCLRWGLPPPDPAMWRDGPSTLYVLHLLRVNDDSYSEEKRAESKMFIELVAAWQGNEIRSH